MKCNWCGKETQNEFCSQEHAQNSKVSRIMEYLSEEMDIAYKATEYPWKVNLTPDAYFTLKHLPGTDWNDNPKDLFYARGEREYLKVIENHNIPFIIHARVDNVNSKFNDICLDDLDRPNIQEEYNTDWNRNLTY